MGEHDVCTGYEDPNFDPFEGAGNAKALNLTADEIVQALLQETCHPEWGKLFSKILYGSLNRYDIIELMYNNTLLKVSDISAWPTYAKVLVGAAMPYKDSSAETLRREALAAFLIELDMKKEEIADRK